MLGIDSTMRTPIHPPMSFSKRLPFRLAVVLVAVTAAFAVTAGAASAKSCGEQVIDDWYGGSLGKHVYAIHCYQDALKIVAARTDISVYSNARQDILYALQAALAAHKRGLGTSPDVTSNIVTADALPSFLGGPDAKNGGAAPSSDRPVTVKPRVLQNSNPISNVLRSSSASSVPLPAIVLGAIALLLLAAGGAAYIARRRQLRG
jgi:hypothetical protein